MVSPEDNKASVERLPDGQEKEDLQKRQKAIKGLLHLLMLNVEDMEPVPKGPMNNKRRTKRSKEFQRLIVSYNNVLSFCSESANVDHKNSAWATFRAMGGVKHLMGSLLPDQGDRQRFCQIYQIDSSLEALDLRMDVSGTNLDPLILRDLQTLMKNYNPYSKAFKDCGQRLEEDSFEAAPVLKRHNPIWITKGTHNKPTSTEVTAIIILNEDGNPSEPLQRDIMVQTTGGDLIRVLYWHACHMALRYPILFPCGEFSWMDQLALNGHKNSANFFACRALQQPHLDAPESENAEGEGDKAACGKGVSKRVTQKEFYRFWLQVGYYEFCCSETRTTLININDPPRYCVFCLSVTW